MSVPATVRLLEVEPDLGRYLTAADEEALDGLTVPALDVPAGALDLPALMAGQHAFGMILLDGMLVRRIVVGESATLLLLGPGDVVGSLGGFSSGLISDHGWRAAAATRMAVLNRDVLFAIHRAPRLVAGLHERSTEQSDRVAIQLAICQLPRVEDRVLSLLWLLAETWGQVTLQGTALRLHLTHETLGGLVGARRSTVTLALGQLTDQGAILRHERGWLLLEAPPTPAPAPVADNDPQLLDLLAGAPDRTNGVNGNGRSPATAADAGLRVQELREASAALRDAFDEARRRMERDLGRLGRTRLRNAELREAGRALRARTAGSVLAGLHHHDHAGGGAGAVERLADDATAKRRAAPVDGVED
jgi:CRP/FNR family transcriptional regulator, cyclic AMP receptor protein